MEWFQVNNVSKISSPALLLFPQRIKYNIDKMISIAGNAERLRPHVKTHKLPQVVDLQIEKGINKFKCATIAEAEMLARQNANEILLAIQPVGPQIDRLFALIDHFPGSVFSCLTDTMNIAMQLSEKAGAKGLRLPVWVDINNGMNRTGILPDEEALKLYKYVAENPFLLAEGLHVYDGHIHEEKIEDRKRICDRDFQPVLSLMEKISNARISKPKIIVGGTPSFPVHAQRKDVELSPGTVLLWDQGYSDRYRDLDFQHAAVLMCRIISKPAPDLLCLDLGHKALASEMPAPRIKFLNLEGTMVTHSEEHMVIKTDDQDLFEVGDVIYGIPTHICPTVDRHDVVFVVEDNQMTTEWRVSARKRKITI